MSLEDKGNIFGFVSVCDNGGGAVVKVEVNNVSRIGIEWP